MILYNVMHKKNKVENTKRKACSELANILK